MIIDIRRDNKNRIYKIARKKYERSHLIETFKMINELSNHDGHFFQYFSNWKFTVKN